MKAFVFFCNPYLRFVASGENANQAYSKLSNEQRYCWANDDGFCVEVKSEYYGLTLSSKALNEIHGVALVA